MLFRLSTLFYNTTTHYTNPELPLPCMSEKIVYLLSKGVVDFSAKKLLYYFIDFVIIINIMSVMQ